ncbi:ribonuclease domain-containing protein [Embleya sp. AB8]|uniref:ribonuclease domain-containing protein n=1 Tax=Embleya sp. AB8 TaxID=3156304 RepID=UPI003C753C1F
MITPRTARRTAVAALFLTAIVVPVARAATTTTPSAPAAVRPADVLEPPLPVEQFPAEVGQACAIWKDLRWPHADRPTDYPVPNTDLVIRGSNVYGNRSGDLPHNGFYREYDVNPRHHGDHRDAERLVRDPGNDTVWYTGDHYANFRRIASGCS